MGLRVEVQFTTALQHALDLATHDFDYKGSDYSWGKFRLVAQLRGMLELVDNMIDNLEASTPLVSKSALIPEHYQESESLLAVLNQVFTQDDLPQNMRRLIDTTIEWTTAVGWSAADLSSALTTSADLASWRSLTVADQILAVIVSSDLDALLARFDGQFVIGQEFTDACPKSSSIPADRRVGFG